MDTLIPTDVQNPTRRKNFFQNKYIYLISSLLYCGTWSYEYLYEWLSAVTVLFSE